MASSSEHINRAYRRTGTLFEGRFRSLVIEADSDLFACQRYIELYPVRARMVPTPEDYPWSSYRCNALGIPDPVIATHPLCTTLGESDDLCRSRYRSLFADAISASETTALRDATNGGLALGSDRFQRKIAAMVGRRTWPGKSGRPKKDQPDANHGRFLPPMFKVGDPGRQALGQLSEPVGLAQLEDVNCSSRPRRTYGRSRSRISKHQSAWSACSGASSRVKSSRSVR